MGTQFSGRQINERIIKHWSGKPAIPADVLREAEAFQ